MSKPKQALATLKAIRALDKKLVPLKGRARRELIQKKHELVLLYIEQLANRVN